MVCLLFRWLSAFLIQTEFVPDEAWQSTEVAYVYTWGRGHLTWEWLVGLRNHLFPFVITALYKTLKWMGADSPYALVRIDGQWGSTGECCPILGKLVGIDDRFS